MLSFPAPFPRFSPAGDQAIVVEIGSDISRVTNARVRDLDGAVRVANWPEIVDTVPSYRSLLVYYDAAKSSYDELRAKLLSLCLSPQTSTGRSRTWRIPVFYGGECEGDLRALAEKVHMPIDKVIAEHVSTEYMVYMVGFSPGFAYLGELPKSLEVPRKAVPARSVPANSIQVGGAQTAVSSMPMPSGWYVIGRTPVRMYDLRREEPFLLQGGDLVTFTPIDLADFTLLSLAADKGSLTPGWEWA